MLSTLHSLKHQRSYFPIAYEKFCDESGWSSFPVHPQQVSLIKPSKAQRSYLRWIPNQQAIKG